MARISDEVISEIKYRNNIEDVISTYVALKRAGSNLNGLCPFHSEKTPSFTVFPKTNSFYCFGCGAAGDVIGFVRRIESLDYPSAVEFLAKRVGITVKHDEWDEERAKKRDRVLQMNREAAKFFRNCLFDPRYGKEGLAYLTEKRKFDMALIRHFGLGFAPNSFELLTRHLTSLGYKDYEMSEAFLCGISQKTGKSFDLFRNRIIVPIISPSGDVIAFGGRVMDDSKPKYLNTSDTPAFKKSRNLFALNFAKNQCAEQLILCEGYMDVIALHSAGFSNAVATLGTAITPDQARLMSRYTKSVVIAYDSDEAGQKAASKAFRVLGEVDVETRILKMEGAKDPDEYIKKFGTEAFSKLLSGTKSEFDFKFDNILQKYDITNTDDKLKALEEVVFIISMISSAAKRDVYIGIAAERLGVNPDMIRHDIDKAYQKSRRAEARKETDAMIAASQGIGDRVNPDYAKNPKAAAAEEKILGILLLYPEYIGELKRLDKLPDPDDLYSAFGKKVYGHMLERGGEAFDIFTLGEELTPEEMDRVVKLKMSREQLGGNGIEMIYELLATMKSAKDRKELTLDEILAQKRKKNNGKK